MLESRENEIIEPGHKDFSYMRFFQRAIAKGKGILPKAKALCQRQSDFAEGKGTLM